ncbi:MAG: LysR family transcriptional regulator [Pseudomonadota bacterium]
MDLRWLDDVLVLLEEGNLTRAAARRNITQPAFSRRIRAFEDWLGTPIIERQSNRINPSPALTSSEDEIRALASRLKELRTKVASYEPNRLTLTLAAQHAPTQSVFPDLALSAKDAFPGLNFRLSAGNLNDCVTLFLRGDASMLLCYEAETIGRLEFGPNVKRALWGTDYLIPVVGGALRYAVRANGQIPADTPAIAYPVDSYFGEVLRLAGHPFGSGELSAEATCVTAYSGGILELVVKGLGVGWVPFSMAYRELESGSLVSLAQGLGKEPLDVALYGDGKSEIATKLLDFWSS